MTILKQHTLGTNYSQRKQEVLARGSRRCMGQVQKSYICSGRQGSARLQVPSLQDEEAEECMIVRSGITAYEISETPRCWHALCPLQV